MRIRPESCNQGTARALKACTASDFLTPPVKLFRKDMNQAVTQFRKAADRGYAPAQAIMGLHYLFHNSAERLAYIQNLRKDVDISEATTMWNIGKSEYDNCRRAGRENCHDPEAPPR